MLFTIKASHESVPAGTYQAKFKAIEPTETTKGKAFRWVFETDKGKAISGLSDGESAPTTKNRMGRWLSALSGKPLSPDVTVDPTEYIGKRYIVIVAATENGTRLETFSPIADSANPRMRTAPCGSVSRMAPSIHMKQFK